MKYKTCLNCAFSKFIRHTGFCYNEKSKYYTKRVNKNHWCQYHEKKINVWS